jgi:hypothetical protein
VGGLTVAGIGRRTRLYISPPEKPGRGTSIHWRREIFGVPHSFTLVVMPNGELRYAVCRYNGYLYDLIKVGMTTWGAALQFACAWDQTHFIIVPPRLRGTRFPRLGLPSTD